MAIADIKDQKSYDSGFPKKIQRIKYNLKINSRLKAARNRKGMSARGVVKALAKQNVNIGHSTLQGYEADEASVNHRYPSLPVLMELAQFYNCSMDYLFGFTDRFKPFSITARETDLFDVLDSRYQVKFNGKLLTNRQREMLLEQIAELLGEKIKP